MKTFVPFAILILIALGGCTNKNKKAEKSSAGGEEATKLTEVAASEPLPDDLEWITNEDDPIFASPEAKKGGTMTASISTFPMTLRSVGPDSNGKFASVLRAISLSLTTIHPNTTNIIPSLASHWAYDKDGKTVYYKLNKNARWSDGKPVTAEDYLFTLEFMRSKHIVAPWFNNHYTEEIKNVRKHGEYIISVTGKIALPRWELHTKYGLAPTPRHFHKLDENWVNNYNWKIEPVTGPYYVDKINKGKSVVLKRIKDWWAKDLKYYKHRYNVDKIIYKVIRDQNVAWEHFKKGELDGYGLTLPDYWHSKSKTEVFEKGYVHKIWFYNDSPQPDYGIWLNQDVEIFKDKNVRLAFSHAMNIEKVIKDVLRNDYMRANTGTSGYGKYTNRNIKAREFSIKKVEEYMQKSGWKRGADGIWEKNGKRYAVRVTYGAPHHTDRLVVLKEEAKKAGIELNLQLLDPSASFKSMLEKKHEVAWSGWSASMRPQYWGQYHSVNAHKPQTNNFSNTDDKEIDKAIDEYRNTIEEDKKVALAHKIQELIHENGAYVPTFLVPYFRSAYWRWWRFPKVPATKLSDSILDPLGFTGGLFWFDAKLKEETLAAKKDGKAFKPVTIIDDTFKVKTSGAAGKGS